MTDTNDDAELERTRAWAATWKWAAKRWRNLVVETRLTTANRLTHDAAPPAGDEGEAMSGEGPMPETCPACKSTIGRRTFIYGNTTYWEFDCGVCVLQEPGQPWTIAFADDCEYAFATAVRLQVEHVAAFQRTLALRNERDAAIQRGDNFATEHSRALLRVGALEGLLRRWHEYFYELEQVPGAADLLIDETDAATAGSDGRDK